MFCFGLQRLIDDKNLSRKEISNVINQSVSQVGMYIQGRRDPDTSVLLKLSKHYGVSIDYLLMNDTPTDTPDYKSLGSNEKKFVDNFIDLPDNDRKKLVDLLSRVTEK